MRRLTDMLRRLVEKAMAADVRLAPFIGIGCPGEIRSDGFHHPERVRSALPVIAGAETVIVLHNDAVVQGLSELPYMRDVQRRGILTIGTGLGNARFTWAQDE